MHADLKWLAENVPQWGGTYGFPYIFFEDPAEGYVNTKNGSVRAYTREEWQAARDELAGVNPFMPAYDNTLDNLREGKINVYTDPSGNRWRLDSDGMITGMCALVTFSSPEEDEAWAEAEMRMDAIGHNGSTGDHYEAPASKYHVQIKGQWVDVYDVLTAYSVTNPADAHAIKKMLCPGKRGAKDGIKDRQEAIVSLQRAIELEQKR